VKEKIPSGYRFIRNFAAFWIRRFFRDIEIHGLNHVPDGALLIVANHPNNLIDSLLIGFAIERKIHFLATSQLFKNRFLASLLRNLGVIPVYRKQDDAASKKEKNVAMFQACAEILKENGAIAIFPEGVTHAEPRVKKIKTGAARIALEAEQQFHPGVKILPVGLNFSVRKSFREEVIINLGKPLTMESYLATYTTDPVVTVDRLTSDLQNAIQNEILHIAAPELELLVKDIEEIYKTELIQDLAEGGNSTPDDFRLSKRMIDGIQYFNQFKPELTCTGSEKFTWMIGCCSKSRKIQLLITVS
jgi:1-acyl-sn-glycerol-3-phosphate acyltransferase